MVLSDEESPLIYGLEFPARAMCAQSSIQADPMPIRFLVGTQSLKNENQVHVIEYVEDCNSNVSSGHKNHHPHQTGNASLAGCGLKKYIFKHSAGEIWDISCHPKYPNLLATCHADLSVQSNSVRYTCTLWQSPIDLSTTTLDEDGPGNNSLVKLNEFAPTNNNENSESSLKMHSDTRRSLWHPEDASQLLTVNTQQLCVWDVESRTLINTLNVNPGEKSFHISGTRWSPHSNCAIVGFGSARNLYANDLRCSNEGSNSFAWTIANAHADTVRDLDFNPNAQYHLVSCGDDCEYKFWDVRNCKVPAVVMRSQHSHWVWSVRYNQYHDQLVLSCSSDSRVVLSRIASFASQPFGHLMDDQDFSSQDENDDNEEEEEDDDEDDKPDEETIDSNRSGEEQSENNGIDTFVRKMIDHSTSKAAQLNAKVMKKKSDEVVSIYDEHEDSVYSAEWSNADPWVFASLSYDGRFVLNRVPKEEKYNLLI